MACRAIFPCITKHVATGFFISSNIGHLICQADGGGGRHILPVRPGTLYNMIGFGRSLGQHFVMQTGPSCEGLL